MHLSAVRPRVETAAWDHLCSGDPGCGLLTAVRVALAGLLIVSIHVDELVHAAERLAEVDDCFAGWRV